MNTGRPGLVAAVVAGVLAIVFSALPAHAQDGSDAADTAEDATLRLVRQSASVESDGVLELVVDWTGPRSENVFLSVVFYQRIDDDNDVGSPPTGVLNRRGPLPLDSISTDGDGNLVTAIPIRSVSPADDDRVYLPGPGVYPLSVEVRTADGPLASFTSAVVRLPQDRQELATLDVSVVLAVSPADGLDLSDALLLLTTYPTVPFTIQLDEGVLTQLENDPPLVAQFASAAGTRAVMTTSGTDLDPSALEEIGQGEFYIQALETTRQRLARLGLEPLDGIVMLAPNVTGAGAGLLVRNGVSAVMSTRTREIDVGTITRSDGRVQILQPDHLITAELADRAGRGNFAASTIYELYARLSLRAAYDRTSIIVGGEGAPPLESLSLETLLLALVEDGPVRVVSLSDTLSTQPTNPLLAAERPEQNLVPSGEAIAQLQRLADTSRSFRGVQNPGLEQLLIDSLSRTRNPEDRTRAIERAKAELLLDLGSISLPESQSLTLTATEGPLPLTIRNGSNGPRSVRLEFRGDRVAVAQDGDIITIPPGETTLELDAEARALGVSTLEVTALTPDRAMVLSSTRYQIRSTAIPGLGWAISGSALLFLLLWWFRTNRTSTPRSPHLVGATGRPKNPDRPAPTETGGGIAADAHLGRRTP